MDHLQISPAQTKIIEIFLQLLAKKPLAKISVTEITRTAHLNRGTFYLYYLDVYDLYTKVSTQFLDALMATFNANYPNEPTPTNFGTLSHKILDYLTTHQKSFQILINADNGANFIEQLHALFVTGIVTKEHISSENKDYLIDVIYNVNGAIGVIIAWQQGKLNCSLETVTRRLAFIFSVI